MIELRGFSAWITSEDLELVEFEPRVDEKNHTVTCWIAGPIGKTFIVHWRDHGSQVDSASYIYIDGFKVSGQFLYGHGEELRRGVRVGPTEERPFVFSSVHADDDVGTGPKSSGKNVGSIVLEIKQITRTEVFVPDSVPQVPSVIRGHRQAGDVCVRYGEAQPTAIRRPTWKIRSYDPNARGPFVTFVFRYRTQDWLISQGIISPDDPIVKQPPTPWPLEEHPPLPTPPATEAIQTAELEPEQESEEEEEEEEESDHEFEAEEYYSPFASNPVSPRSPVGSLGLLGMRPGSSRNVSNGSSRSYSGTWDPTPTSGHYEEISWDEYRPGERPDRHADRHALDDYYK
ncbi:hypothetical protein OH77DRAFT_1499876 [Trametes cingulata]|nr:hypothetical protein OH77DRAFT_1499876 [Trametes cingulata]